jgi:hypothetical protein
VGTIVVSEAEISNLWNIGRAFKAQSSTLATPTILAQLAQQNRPPLDCTPRGDGGTLGKESS